jgi:hypothetical protein
MRCRFTLPQAELVRVAEQFGLQVVSPIPPARASTAQTGAVVAQVRLRPSPYWAYEGSQPFPNLVGAPSADAEQRAVSELYFAFAFELTTKPAISTPSFRSATRDATDATPSCEEFVPAQHHGASPARDPFANALLDGQRLKAVAPDVEVHEATRQMAELALVSHRAGGHRTASVSATMGNAEAEEAEGAAGVYVGALAQTHELQVGKKLGQKYHVKKGCSGSSVCTTVAKAKRFEHTMCKRCGGPTTGSTRASHASALPGEPCTGADAGRSRSRDGDRGPQADKPRGEAGPQGSPPPLAASCIAHEPLADELLGFKAAGFALYRLTQTGAPRFVTKPPRSFEPSRAPRASHAGAQPLVRTRAALCT